VLIAEFKITNPDRIVPVIRVPQLPAAAIHRFPLVQQSHIALPPKTRFGQ
jgi:hypothetical protein